MRNLSPNALIGILLALSPTLALAGASPIAFSREEVAQTTAQSALISETASACLASTWQTHNEFFDSHGYSKFFGNRKAENKTAEGRKQVLLRLLPALAARVRAGDPAALRELNQREKELEATSCIGLALKCLGQGFHKAGLDPTWQKVLAWVSRRDAAGNPTFYGTDLQKALIDLGWKSYYWNPDPAQNSAWDAEDQSLNPLKPGKVWNPVWGGHALNYAAATRRHTYFGIPIHDARTLVGFKTSPPREFAAAPFFVGIAHSGYHVFPGFGGKVIEAHSMRDLGSRNNMEVGLFNPLDQDEGGSPRWTRSERYRSGVIVVPPGYMEARP